MHNFPTTNSIFKVEENADPAFIPGLFTLGLKAEIDVKKFKNQISR